MLTRREFIKFVGSMGAAVLNPLQQLGKWGSLEAAQADQLVGELYAGFVLLPVNALWPFFVQYAPAPILGQVDDQNNPEDFACRGETLWFENLEELINHIPFRFYIPGSLPEDLVFIHGHIIHFKKCKGIFEARANFSYSHSQQPIVSISAMPQFPRPYPVHAVDFPT